MYKDFKFTEAVDYLLKREKPYEPSTEEEKRRAHMVEICEGYIANLNNPDPEYQANAFAEGYTLQDPFGTAPTEMVDYWGSILDTTFNPVKAEMVGPVRTTLTNEAAFDFRIYAEIGGHALAIDIIDVLTFNEEGKVSGMRAYWTPDNATLIL